ncbi:SH3 domain-containing protein [Oryzomonas japonica]|uniref:SH3 domain-containing protein n=2 Tax=Oryzomonas japonica TaxID=2603858 RepID=A0A7J4ZUP2_9BACT|nr:SH3 domain-containing protein [Oryzomonas japonica]
MGMVMFKKRGWYPLAACLALLGTSLMTFGDAWAWRSPPPAYWSGPRFRELPREHRVIGYGRDSFYFTRGRYYRRGGDGFFLVAPPFGLVVPSLPLGFAALVVGGLTYYELNGIYYRQAPEGYVVVEPPATVVTPAPSAVESAQRVVVQSELLNVRSGPSLEQDILTEVGRGTVLNVLGKVPDWYYVELTNGERGWVMERFVTPMKPVPQG